MSEVFDLASLDPLIEAQEAGIEVEVKGPDGKPLGPNGWRVRVAGQDSARFRAAQAEITQERLDSENIEVSADDLQRNAVRILAKCIISWTPIILGGKELECNERNARMLLERYGFIREQLERKAGNRKLFFRGLAKG